MVTGLLLLAPLGLLAQDYQTGLGLRGGYVSGVTVKHFLDESTALEGILSFGRWGFTTTGLYEIHANAFDVERLSWYYGGGAHIGSWNDYYPTLSERGQYGVIGLDGIVGMEYKIEDIPITLSADWKPSLNLLGYTGFIGWGGAFSVRYTF